MEQKTEPVNIVIFEYEQNGTILTAKGVSVTTKDAALLEVMQGLDEMQLKKKIHFNVLRIHAEWKPSEIVTSLIQSKYPNANLSYTFEEGDEEKFEKMLQDAKNQESKTAIEERKIAKKKWYEIWKYDDN
jgi:aspartokinase